MIMWIDILLLDEHDPLLEGTGKGVFRIDLQCFAGLFQRPFVVLCPHQFIRETKMLRDEIALLICCNNGRFLSKHNGNSPGYWSLNY